MLQRLLAARTCYFHAFPCVLQNTGDPQGTLDVNNLVFDQHNNIVVQNMLPR